MHDRADVRLIDSVSAFESLRDSWAALRLRIGTTTPFDSHRWLAAWWRASEERPGGPTIRVVTVWNQDALVAALPLQIGQARYRGLPVSRASMLGGGWGAASLLIPDAEASRACAGIAATLREWSRPGWQVLQLSPLRVYEPTLVTTVAKLRGSGFRPRQASTTQQYLSLAESWEAFLRTRSRNFRKNIKRKRQACIDAELKTTARRRPAADDLLSVVRDVSRHSWQGKEGIAVASTFFGRRFYELAADGDGDFEIDLMTLEKDGEPVAYLVGMISDGVYHAFDTGFVPAWAEQSPGLALHFAVLERLHAEGAKEFDFGYQHAYKDRFDPATRTVAELCVFRSSLIEAWDRLSTYYLDKVRRQKTKTAPRAAR